MTRFYPAGDLNQHLRAQLEALPKAQEGDTAGRAVMHVAALRVVAETMLALATALAAFGHNRIASGDVKPGNFVWDPEAGVVRAIDVESFRLLDLSSPCGRTRSPDHMCTLGYAPYEFTGCERGEDVVYLTSDVYSLQQCWRGDAREQVQQVLGEAVWVAKPKRGTLAWLLDDLMDDCRQYEPSDRPMPWDLARDLGIIVKAAANLEATLREAQQQRQQ